ncbi:MAG TPA: septation protein SepH [Microbacteriaceae bacterium]|nr:septation protein SepH [Microbacteriaceae bacterium]
MEELHIVGLEDGSLVLAGSDGGRYTLAIDDSLHARIRQSIPSDPGSARKLSPKEIQAHIRGGMSAVDVAQVTGAPLEYIERFEGPVMAEREYVVESALAIPVHMAAADPLAQATTFGDAILERLHILGAEAERWSAWKESGGWVVKLGYMLGAIEHDARWHFDPKRQTLSPINAEAVGLSRQDPGHEVEPPRLRAVIPLRGDDEAPSHPERFDSDAFAVDPSSMIDSGPVLAPIGSRPAPRQQNAGHDQTADLLEALRRRRGERETPSYEDEPTPGGSAQGGSMHVVELDLDLDLDDPPASPEPTARHKTGGLGARKGRPQMPSWDEIVFGARSDDDDLA